MGKQSRRKRKGAAATAAARQAPIAPTPSNNPKWSMLVPFTTPQEMKDAAQDAIVKFNDSNIPMSAVPTWRVYMRRANIWLESSVKPRRRRIRRDYRPWIITIFLVNTQQNDDESIKDVDILTAAFSMVHDDTHIHLDPRDSPLTTTMVLASLGQMMDKLESKPSQLVFWPAVGGALRIRHLQPLVSQLKSQVLSIQLTMLPAQETPNDAPDSCTNAILLLDRTNAEVQLFSRENSKLVQRMETQLHGFEAELHNQNSVISPSHIVPCVTQTLQLSVVQLQQLFQASQLFHQTTPWELLSNFNPVKITFSDTHTELYAVVVGNGSWEARGLYVYKSLQELKAAGSGNTSSNREIHQSVLRYCERVETPFGTLNQVDELELEIDTHDGADGEQSYPSWYSTTVLSSDGPPTEEQFNTMRSTPPALEDIPALTIGTAAIAKLVTSGHVAAMEDEHGETRTSLPVGQVPISVDLMHQEHPMVVSVQVLQLSPMDFMPSNNMMLDSLSLGDDKVCNYCQKPRYLIPGKRLLACGRCYSVDYCSKACQLHDFKRHKQECKRLAAASARNSK